MKKTLKMLGLILAAVLSLLVLACCDGDVSERESTPSASVSTRGEETRLPSLESEERDESEESEERDERETQGVHGGESPAACYRIYYSNLMGGVAPALTEYSSDEGVSAKRMPVPACAGYRFEGWYLSEDGTAERVTEIPAGSTRDYRLYARWSPVKYRITYENAPLYEGKTTYTVEEDVFLSAPVHKGLTFSHWTDADGNTVTDIERGSVGDVTLTAHWKHKTNVVHPVTGDAARGSYFDATNGRYYFAYELGRVEGLVLSTVDELEKRGEEAYTRFDRSALTLDADAASAAAYQISVAITKNGAWWEALEWAREASRGGVGGDAALLDLENGDVAAQLDGVLGAACEDGAERAYASYAPVEWWDERALVPSTVGYASGASVQLDSFDVTAQDPAGIYRYVCMGSARVYALIVYDPAEESYSVGAYSLLEKALRADVIYDTSDPTVAASDGLAFAVNEEALRESLAGVYFLRYDANGGKGATVAALLGVGEEGTLAPCGFTRLNHRFLGWAIAPEGYVLYADGATVPSLGKDGETVTLYAVWESLGHFNATWARGIGYTVRVTRTASPVGAECGEVQNGAEIYPGDVLQVEYTPLEGFALQRHGATEITVTGDVGRGAIFASATFRSYTVCFDANGGTGETAQMEYRSGTQATLSSCGFSRMGCDFLGWSTAPGGAVEYGDGETISSVPAGADASYTAVLYAVWEPRASFSTTFSCYDTIHDDDGSIYYVTFPLHDRMQLEMLKARYANAQITVSFTAIELDKGYQEVHVYSGSSYGGRQLLFEESDLETAGSSLGSQWWSFTFDVNSACVGDYLYTDFGAHGSFEDDWVLDGVHVTVTFY